MTPVIGPRQVTHARAGREPDPAAVRRQGTSRTGRSYKIRCISTAVC